MIYNILNNRGAMRQKYLGKKAAKAAVGKGRLPKAARGGGLVLAERNKMRYAVAEMRRAIYTV